MFLFGHKIKRGIFATIHENGPPTTLVVVNVPGQIVNDTVQTVPTGVFVGVLG